MQAHVIPPFKFQLKPIPAHFDSLFHLSDFLICFRSCGSIKFHACNHFQASISQAFLMPIIAEKILLVLQLPDITGCYQLFKNVTSNEPIRWSMTIWWPFPISNDVRKLIIQTKRKLFQKQFIVWWEINQNKFFLL